MTTSETPRQTISRWTLLRVLWRSFFLQAAANYERMQNVGFAFCMSPALAKIHEGKDFNAALTRHLEFFNTHPYMASALIGASIRMEEEIAAGTKKPQDVRDFKRFMMGPMAAIGDSFFWMSLRPFAAAWAIMGALSGIYWAPIGFLILFNLCHLSLRVYGLFAGYRDGEKVCERIHRLALVRFAERTHYLAAIFLGASGAIFADRAMASKVSLTDGIEPFLMFSMILIYLLALKRGIAMVGVLYGSAFCTVLLVMFLNSLFPLV